MLEDEKDTCSGRYIDLDKVEKWEDVNATAEYLYNNQILIYSPKMYRLLVQADLKARMLPVFPLSMKEELEQGCK